MDDTADPKPNMRIFATVSDMKSAYRQLGRPAALGEAIVATGIEGFFHLLDGGTITIGGNTYELAQV